MYLVREQLTGSNCARLKTCNFVLFVDDFASSGHEQSLLRHGDRWQASWQNRDGLVWKRCAEGQSARTTLFVHIEAACSLTFSFPCHIQTVENFRAQCTGEKGKGKTFGKALHYKVRVDHRLRTYMSELAHLQQQLTVIFLFNAYSHTGLQVPPHHPRLYAARYESFTSILSTC